MPNLNQMASTPTRQPKYNVETSDAKWARTKAQLMSPSRRQALMAELIKLDQQGALDILGELGRAEHGERVKARQQMAK